MEDVDAHGGGREEHGDGANEAPGRTAPAQQWWCTSEGEASEGRRCGDGQTQTMTILECGRIC